MERASVSPLYCTGWPFGAVPRAPSVGTYFWVTHIRVRCAWCSVCLKIMSEYWSYTNVCYISKYNTHMKPLFTGLKISKFHWSKSYIQQPRLISAIWNKNRWKTWSGKGKRSKVKQSLYRPGQGEMFPGGWGSQISWPLPLVLISVRLRIPQGHSADGRFMSIERFQWHCRESNPWPPGLYLVLPVISAV